MALFGLSGLSLLFSLLVLAPAKVQRASQQVIYKLFLLTSDEATVDDTQLCNASGVKSGLIRYWCFTVVFDLSSRRTGNNARF